MCCNIINRKIIYCHFTFLCSLLILLIYTQFFCPFFSLTGGGAGGGAGSEKIAVLEQKLFKLQEEVTELHRQRGEVWYGSVRTICVGTIPKSMLEYSTLWAPM